MLKPEQTILVGCLALVGCGAPVVVAPHAEPLDEADGFRRPTGGEPRKMDPRLEPRRSHPIHRPSLRNRIAPRLRRRYCHRLDRPERQRGHVPHIDRPVQHVSGGVQLVIDRAGGELGFPVQQPPLEVSEISRGEVFDGLIAEDLGESPQGVGQVLYRVRRTAVGFAGLDKLPAEVSHCPAADSMGRAGRKVGIPRLTPYSPFLEVLEVFPAGRRFVCPEPMELPPVLDEPPLLVAMKGQFWRPGIHFGCISRVVFGADRFGRIFRNRNSPKHLPNWAIRDLNPGPHGCDGLGDRLAAEEKEECRQITTVVFSVSRVMLRSCRDRSQSANSIRFSSTSDAARPGGLDNFHGPCIRRWGGSATESRAMQLKPIPGYPSHMARSDGTIFKFLDKSRPEAGLRVCKQKRRGDGYRIVRVFSNYREKWRHVHALILAAFVGPRPRGMVSRHLDGNKDNNAIANLCYGTQAENMQDRRLHGRDPIGERNGRAVLTREQAEEIRYLVASGHSHSKVAARFGVCKGAVTDIVKGRNWRFASGPRAQTGLPHSEHGPSRERRL